MKRWISTCFSIHDWIEGSKTLSEKANLVGYWSVSVSTTGSKGRKLSTSAAKRSATLRFSIHDWIEGSKTGRPLHCACAHRPVSVSTTGSKGRKPGSKERGRKSKNCFSIHDWIEGSKTDDLTARAYAIDQFQYPRLDRRVENSIALMMTSLDLLFQYPRLDRRVENKKLRSSSNHYRLRFSIHDWIEGSKTLCDRYIRRINRVFQYPRLDRRVENNVRLGLFHCFSCVSVSTTGSKGRKLRRSTRRGPRQIVSVSTTGSKGRKRSSIAGPR